MRRPVALIAIALVVVTASHGQRVNRTFAGAPAPASPLVRTVNEVTLTIGGVAARVVSAGLAPGEVGVYPVKVVVPEGIAAGDAAPALLTVAGQTSPQVTMAVK